MKNETQNVTWCTFRCNVQKRNRRVYTFTSIKTVKSRDYCLHCRLRYGRHAALFGDTVVKCYKINSHAPVLYSTKGSKIRNALYQ